MTPCEWLDSTRDLRFSLTRRVWRSASPAETARFKGRPAPWVCGLSHKVIPMFEHRVLEITEDVMLKWRLLVEEGRKVGHTFSHSSHLTGGAMPR